MYGMRPASDASCFIMLCASTAFKASTQTPTYDKKHKGTWDIIGITLELHWILTGFAPGVLPWIQVGFK